MGKRLFVGSLPFETTDAQLQELFSSCGRVENAKVIMDKATGRSKGFGFVEMTTDLEAQAAIQKLNGSTLGSRSIVVNEARPREDRPGPSPQHGNQTGRGGFGTSRREDGFGNRKDNGGGDRRGGNFRGRRDEFGGGRRREGRPGGDRKNPNRGDYGNRW